MMRSVRVCVLLAVGAGAASTHRTHSELATEQRANPIRRVVDLLQSMQKQVIEEGKKDEALYEKFMCYCTTGKEQLETSIAAAEEKIGKVTAALEEAEAKKVQTDEDIKKAKADRAQGKEALAKATALRQKEATEYAKLSSDLQTNLSAIAAAIKAIEQGMAGSFLQTSAGAVLRRLAVDAEMSSADRDALTSWLAQGEGYVPKSGQIVGILKEMSDTMSKELADATATEEQSIKDYDALAAAKTAEINALTEEIETKMELSGELAVKIVNMKEDLDDTQKALIEDKKFLAELEKGCDTKKAEWEERQKIRTEELLALHETIQILNSDDALELFKKTLPSPTLMQVQTISKDMQAAALKVLHGAKSHDPRVALISLALRGGAKSFEKVITMIDSMVALLKEEQVGDDKKKAFCEKELDTAEDDKKILELTLGDLEKAIDTAKEDIATLTDEIAALLKGIGDLDKQVKDATATRAEENAFYKKTMQEDTAAKDILKMAKNRLAKFYNPKLYVAPAKMERSEMGRIYEEEMSLSQRADPGPPPETWDAYKTQSEEHGGVVAMMDLLIGDLEKEMSSMTTQEKDDQAEYEAFMKAAGDKRAADSKSAEQKTGEKAETEAALLKLEKDHKDKTKELYLKEVQIKDLHMECDWLLANFEYRKEARAGEVDSLLKAKAVLSGADYSLLQTAASHSQ